MQHALRYVWSIPSARAEQKRIILSLNIPIRNIMTDRAVFARTSSVIFMDLSKYSRAQYFRPQIGAFHWALCVVWFTYPMKNRVYCVKAQRRRTIHHV